VANVRHAPVSCWARRIPVSWRASKVGGDNHAGWGGGNAVGGAEEIAVRRAAHGSPTSAAGLSGNCVGEVLLAGRWPGGGPRLAPGWAGARLLARFGSGEPARNLVRARLDWRLSYSRWECPPPPGADFGIAPRCRGRRKKKLRPGCWGRPASAALPAGASARWLAPPGWWVTRWPLSQLSGVIGAGS